MTHSNETKKKAIQYFDEGHTIKKSSEMASVGYNTLFLWLRARENKPSYKSYIRKYNREKKKIDLDFLKSFLENKPNKTIRELYSEWNGPPCKKSTFYLALKKVGYKLTKEKCRRFPIVYD